MADAELSYTQRMREARLERARMAVFNQAGLTHRHPDRAPLRERFLDLNDAYFDARLGRAPAVEIERLMRASDAALLAAKESGIHVRDLGISLDRAKRRLRRARRARGDQLRRAGFEPAQTPRTIS